MNIVVNSNKNYAKLMINSRGSIFLVNTNENKIGTLLIIGKESEYLPSQIGKSLPNEDSTLQDFDGTITLSND